MPPSRKEAILSRVRAALGRPAGNAAPEPLPPFTAPRAERDAGSLPARFSLELEKVGGRVTHLPSREAVGDFLAGLLAAERSAKSVVSNAGVLSGAAGEARANVIPPWGEFLGRNSAARRDGETGAAAQLLRDEYKHLLVEAEFGVTSADYGLADTGTLVLISGGEQHRLPSLLPPVHVCVLRTDLILPSMSDLLMRTRRSFAAPGTAPAALTCITGPSRTADIEQCIAIGIHGPQELHVLLYPPP